MGVTAKLSPIRLVHAARVLDDDRLASKDLREEASRSRRDAARPTRRVLAAVEVVSLELAGLVVEQEEREVVRAGQLEHVLRHRGHEARRVERGLDGEAQAGEARQKTGRLMGTAGGPGGAARPQEES